MNNRRIDNCAGSNPHRRERYRSMSSGSRGTEKDEDAGALKAVGVEAARFFFRAGRLEEGAVVGGAPLNLLHSVASFSGTPLGHSERCFRLPEKNSKNFATA